MNNVENEKEISKVNFCKDENNIYIGLIENIEFSFEAVMNHIKNLEEDITNLMNYKMLVLCLSNAIELLFKFMIGHREEILLYCEEDMGKVLKKYKKAHLAGFTKLESYFCFIH